MTSKTIYSDAYRELTVLLREAREKSRITQEALAKALGEDQPLYGLFHSFNPPPDESETVASMPLAT